MGRKLKKFYEGYKKLNKNVNRFRKGVNKSEFSHLAYGFSEGVSDFVGLPEFESQRRGRRRREDNIFGL